MTLVESQRHKKIKFYENPPTGSEFFHSDGENDGPNANNRFSQFCKRS